MTAPPTVIRERLKTIIRAEFSSAELDEVRDDRMHGSLGEGKGVASTFPINEVEDSDNALIQTTDIGVQLYMAWYGDIDPEQRVDPALIEAWVDRFKRATRPQSGLNINEAWYFRVIRVDYVPDPTGNISRALVLVRGFGPNLVETTG